MNAPFAIGETMAGKYRIERVVGEGGMGVVVAAMHLQLEHLVAIKFLLPEAMENKETVERFAREARTLAKLKSEHVGRVIDVGVTDGGSPYMVMEYLEGRDLDQELQVRGALPVDEAVDYLLQACEAIAEAHAAGVVHRDLKPANLFLARRPTGGTTVKVLDFGISKTKSKDMHEAGLTKTSSLMGSPLYMSPEQLARSRDVDARSDIWALGVILYELVTGKLPFDGDTIAELVTSVLHTPPPALGELRVDAPPELAKVIERCLAKSADSRFADIGELAHALLPFASAKGGRSLERIEEALQKPALVPSNASHRVSIPVPLSNSSLKVAALASTASTFSADPPSADRPIGPQDRTIRDVLPPAGRPRRTGGMVLIAAVAVAAVGVVLTLQRGSGSASHVSNAANGSSSSDAPNASAAATGSPQNAHPVATPAPTSSSPSSDRGDAQASVATSSVVGAPSTAMAPADPSASGAAVGAVPMASPTTNATATATPKPPSATGHTRNPSTSTSATSAATNTPWHVELK
jgi:serine/threonine-protein kinase